MKKFNKKTLLDDWKVGAFSLCVGLIITFLLWSLAHISFIFMWFLITLISIPIWSQIVEKARKKYYWCGFVDAILNYLGSSEENLEDEEDGPRLED